MTSESLQRHERAQTIGVMLQAARQQRGLSVKQIADSQHLRPAVITAIEEGRYDTIGSELFLKGYVRAYASYVGLDGDAIIRSLDSELVPLRKEQEAAKKSDPLVTIERRKRKKRHVARVVLILVVIIVVAVLLALEVFFSDEGQATDEASAAQSSSVDTDPGDSDNEPLLLSTDDVAPVVTDDRLDQAAREAEVTEVEPVSVAEAGADPVLAPESLANSASLQASFSGACWVQVIDGNGQRLVSSLKGSGDRVDVSGPPPFKVIVGAMDALNTLTFQGEAVDLTALRVTNNRAEFSLDN